MSDLLNPPAPSRGYAESLLDFMEEALLVALPDGALVCWNAAAARLFGYSEEDAPALRLEQLQAGGMPPTIADAAQHVFQGAARWAGKIHFQCRGGRRGTGEAIARPLPDGAALLSIRETFLSAPIPVASEHQLLRALIDSIPDYIFLKDTAGRYLFRNRSEREAWGYDDAEFLGRTSMETPLGPEIGGRYYADDMQVIRTGQPVVNRQEPFRLKDGRAGWLLTSKYPTRDAEGRVTGLVGIARDITEFRRAGIDLSSMRARLAAHLDHMLLAILELDSHLRVVRWGGRATALFGWTEAEALGRTLAELELVHPDDAPRVRVMLEQLQSGAQPSCTHENRNLDRQGRTHHCLWYNSVVRGDDGEVLSYLSLAQEVTTQVEAIEKLRASEHLLQTLIDATNTGYALLDLHGRILGVNGKDAAAFGLNHAGEFGGRLFADFIAAPQRDLFALEMRRLLENGYLHQLEVDIHGGGPATTPFELNAKVEHSETGPRLHLFYRNISARRQAAEEHRALEYKLLETQKLESLGVLAGGIAHDFNNLLTGILGNASLAASVAGPTSSVQSYLEPIEKAALRAADLCKQMLAYSGKGRFVVREIDLNALVNETADLLRVSISKRAALRFQFGERLPAVNADGTQLRQVIMNLIINASDALGEADGIIAVSTGTQTLNLTDLTEAHASSEALPGEYLWCEVADTGCGMSPEVLARIFDPFFTTKFTGRGLGLAAVLGIVRSHRGALKVRSEPGRGTTFRVYLPAARRPVRELLGSASSAATWRGEGTVLLVDDEETVRITTRRMLEGMGFTVQSAIDGLEALRAFTEHPDVRFILLDLSMPRLDGVETFREIRKLRPEARVILMSGFSKIEALKRFGMDGLAGFLQKPFTMRQLAEKAKAVLTEGKA